MIKKNLRKKLSSQRTALSFEENQQKSCKILIHVHHFILTNYTKKIPIYLYHSSSIEVTTRKLMAQLLNRGFSVYLPRIEEREIYFYQINSSKDLEWNKQYRIKEPNKKYCIRGSDFQRGLLLMPVLGFDDSMMRIGYGGGFYDRFLQRTRFKERYGLAFNCQYTKKIPREPHDYGLKGVFTETGLKTKNFL